MEEVNIFIALLNTVICIATVIGNVLILTAVITKPRLHIPPNVLLCNLAFADLGVGLFTQPFFIAVQVTENSLVLETGMNLTILVFAGVSMVGMTLISIDRYFALSLHLRYQAVVTVIRSIKIVVMLWTVAGIVIVIYFFYLRFIRLIGTLGALLCFVTSTVVYARISKIVRRHKKQIKDQSLSLGSAAHTGPLPKHGKSIKTMYLVNGFFVLSWLPLVLLVVTGYRLKLAFGEERYNHMEQIAITVFLSKSLANPILYCLRVRQIREAVMKLTTRTCKRFIRNRRNSPPINNNDQQQR